MVPAAPAGTALGIYGAGTGGGSLAAFGAPILAGAWGLGVLGVALLAAIWLCVWAAPGADALTGPAKRLADFARPLRSSELGAQPVLLPDVRGFVAMAMALPIFLTDMFGVTRDAGCGRPGSWCWRRG